MSEIECVDCSFHESNGQCKIGLQDRRGDFFWGHLGNGLSVAPFVATPCQVIRRMLSLAELKPREILYDLGSGDGRILLLAAGEFSAQAVGFEVDEELVQKALAKVQAANLENRVTIVHDNLFKANLHRADVITMYLSPNGNREVKSKLESELSVGTRVVSLEFEIPNWVSQKVEKIVDDGLIYTIYVYHR